MSHVEQRHRDAAYGWLEDNDLPVMHDGELAILLADTERAALDRAIAIEPHFGYEPDIQITGDGYLETPIAHYCRGAGCSQPEGKPHLRDCPVAAIYALAAAPTTEDRT